MEKGQAIGIFGGTFNPIHYGHLLTAATALEQCELEKVIFVPSAIPPHKIGQVDTEVERRYEMTLLATMDHPNFVVSRVEMEREGASYTIDTVKHFHQIYLNHDLYFITGADTILEIDSWKSPEELMELVHFVVAGRLGYSYSGLEKDFYEKNRERIHFLEMPRLEISSTEIRQRVQKDQSIQYLIPPTVEAYIKKYKLYLK